MESCKKYIKEGKEINVSVSTEEQAKRLINEARPELPEYPRYTMGSSPGYEVHPIEKGYNHDLPHIKWQDWTLKKLAELMDIFLLRESDSYD